MFLLPFITGIWQLITRTKRASIATIDLSDPLKFESLSKVTVDLSEDIYCNTPYMAKCGDTYFSFLENPRYLNKGIVHKQISADAVKHMPKILVWDWNGDEKVGIPKTRIIVIRGTHSLQEWKDNFDCEEINGTILNINGYFHKNFAETGLRMWNELEKDITESNLPIVITGHSRGGSLSEILHVIAKKKSPNQPIYCMAYAPAPSMSLDDSEKKLAEDMHGFVFRKDPITRMFIGQVVGIVCGKNMKRCKTISDLTQISLPLCIEIFSEDECSKTYIDSFIGTIGRFLGSVVKKFKDTLAAKGLYEQRKIIGRVLNSYVKDPNSIHITKHEGILHKLKWYNKSGKKQIPKQKGCTRREVYKTQLSSPDELKPLRKLIKTIKNDLNDHYPAFYRHAIHDDVCPTQSSKLLDDEFEFMDSDNDEEINIKLSSDMIPKEIKYPSWLPKIEDDEVNFLCKTPETPETSTYYELSNNDDDNQYECEGHVIDCDPSKIIGAMCRNLTHICRFNATTGLDECRKFATTPGEDDLRCAEKDSEKCYKMSSSTNKSSCASSSNINHGSSIGSSEKDGNSGSKSSNNGISSSGISNDQEKCPDPDSCPLDNPIQSVYIGGSTLVKFQPVYDVMKNARNKIGHLIPPPNFLHTAMWIGPSDKNDDVEGAIIVYGEYYSSGKDPTYLSCDGARAFAMTLGDFKKNFAAHEIKKLIPGRNMTVFAFLDKIDNSGNWGAYDYNWAFHNCQHFTAKCIKILRAKRERPSEFDWADLPPSIMKTLNRNEYEY